MVRQYLRAGGFLVLLVIGCSSRIDPERVQQMALYSIDGVNWEGPGQSPKSEPLHQYPILGKVDITDPDQRKYLIAALEAGMAYRGDTLACHFPRHALRIVESGRTHDFVICFECGNFKEYVDGKPSRSGRFDPALRPMFTGPLDEAGIPLVPPNPGGKAETPTQKP
jgi:hypothetical protein